MITIQLQGGESSREVDAHMAALIAYREQLRPGTVADTPLPTLDLDGPSGGEQMAQRAVTPQDVMNAIEYSREQELRVLRPVDTLAALPATPLNVPAAPVSAVPPVPPAPSVADAGASATAPEAPQAGAAPLPPVPPLPPASPSAPWEDATPAAQAPAPAADLDSTGLPWDGRIHSESRAKVADGSWRKRRNTDPAVTAQVEAELRALMGIAPAAAPVSAIPPAPPAVGATETPEAPAPVAPTPPVPPAPPVQPATAALPPDDFEPWFKRYVSAMQQGKITGEAVQAALTQMAQSHGLATILDLKQRPELRDVFASMVPGLAEHVAQGGAA